MIGACVPRCWAQTRPQHLMNPSHYQKDMVPACVWCLQAAAQAAQLDALTGELQASEVARQRLQRLVQRRALQVGGGLRS